MSRKSTTLTNGEEVSIGDYVTIIHAPNDMGPSVGDRCRVVSVESFEVRVAFIGPRGETFGKHLSNIKRAHDPSLMLDEGL